MAPKGYDHLIEWFWDSASNGVEITCLLTLPVFTEVIAPTTEISRLRCLIGLIAQF